MRIHLYSCKRFAAFLERSPETATADDIRRFQLFLVEGGASICNRNRIMTGVRFLFRVTLRRHDLAAEIYHLKAPQKVPVVMSQDEIRRLLAMAANIKVRTMLSLAYGCGLRAGEVVRLRVGDIDSVQHIIRVVQAKGLKDRNVMLPADTLIEFCGLVGTIIIYEDGTYDPRHPNDRLLLGMKGTMPAEVALTAVPPAPIRTRPWSMPSCSRQPARPCSP